MAKIIQSLDSSKAHDTGVFPSEWKKGNIVPIHKKGDKQTVSLLPICEKILERLILND